MFTAVDTALFRDLETINTTSSRVLFFRMHSGVNKTQDLSSTQALKYEVEKQKQPHHTFGFQSSSVHHEWELIISRKMESAKVCALLSSGVIIKCKRKTYILYKSIFSLYPSQEHCGSGVYPRNAGCEAGIHPGDIIPSQYCV